MKTLPKFLLIVLIPFMTTDLTSCGGGGGGTEEASVQDFAPESLEVGTIITLIPAGGEKEAAISVKYLGNDRMDIVSYSVSGIQRDGFCVYRKEQVNTGTILLHINESVDNGTHVVSAKLTFTAETEGTTQWEYKYSLPGSDNRNKVGQGTFNLQKPQ